MIEWLKGAQTDIMLGLASICAIIVLFTLITKTLPKRRQFILLVMESCSSVWLFADRVAYLYHGVPGQAAYYYVRISNCLVFIMTICVLESINKYLEDVMLNEGAFKKVPVVLKISDYLAAAAIILVIVSQFTGLYYTFDSSNTYQRSKLYFISYIFPYSILVIMVVVMLLY
ncbi:MAG: diguanylate cyclase, partial [Lachnospiraceae bacterium]|nr:diguanylate cyclase [Lachnospiraceae bacterium]